jgi:hypothetical protein
MKHDIAMAWAKDLRENPDKQARGALFTGEGYCCLGRLCLVLGYTFEARDNGGETRYYVPGTTTFAILPTSVADEAGLQGDNGPLPPEAYQERKGAVRYKDDKHESLTSLNDNGFTFAEIADVIEQHWERL